MPDAPPETDDPRPATPGGGHHAPDPGRTGLDGLDGLEAWLASAVADDAARARSRRHWLERQADETATVAGVLVDLAERGHPVVLAMHHGRRRRGLVRLVGADFVALRTVSNEEVLVRTTSVAWVTPEPGGPTVRGARTLRTSASFADAVRQLAETRPRVAVVTTGGDARTGVLRSVGIDVAVLRLDGDGGTVYLPLGSLAELSPTVSG